MIFRDKIHIIYDNIQDQEKRNLSPDFYFKKKEDKQMIQPGSVKPGDKVIVKEGLNDMFVATVVKITKQGNIRIDSDLTKYTFDPHGDENNGLLHAICHMELYPYSEEAEDYIKKKAAKKKALQMCHYITSAADKHELQELISNLQGWLHDIDDSTRRMK